MTTTTYLWDPVSDNVLSEDDGTTTTLYTQEPQTYGDLISQNDGTDSHWYHFDGRGDTRELTDDTETVADTRLYDAWGNIVASSGTTPMLFQFVGKLGYAFDATLDQYYVRARWYQPGSGRWSSEDPLLFVEGIDLYLYCGNNAASHSDPGGLLTARPAGNPGSVQRWGYCGAYMRTIQWKLKRNERNGLILQRVCVDTSVETCCETHAIEYQEYQKGSPIGGPLNSGGCSGPCYFELWFVNRKGQVTAQPGGTGAASPQDIFASPGYKGQTKGYESKTGEAYFIPESWIVPDWELVQYEFSNHSTGGGVTQAGALYSACGNNGVVWSFFETLQGNVGRDGISAAYRSVRAEWDCCDGRQKTTGEVEP